MPDAAGPPAGALPAESHRARFARPSALVIDPRGSDAAFVARALRPEFDIRLAADPEAAEAALRAPETGLAVVVADHDMASARRYLAAIARNRPHAARIAVAPPSDPDIFGLEAAGAEHVLLRPLFETALRLAARSARRFFETRLALAESRIDLARAAAGLAVAAFSHLD